MEYLLIPLVALLASALTLFSGFGLGTILMPAFVLFFPIELAVAMTGVVHFANNLFKLGMLGGHAHRRTVLWFGLPAIGAAFVGALLLTWLTGLPALAEYALFGRTFTVTPAGVIVAIPMLAFAILETLPWFEKLAVPPEYLPLGGLLSGFFGGLSGHQGALRSAFLIRAGLSKEAFIATGVVIACLVDVTRLTTYAADMTETGGRINWPLVSLATAAAFAGAFVGARLMKKVTYRAMQVLVAVMLGVLAIGLASGLVPSK